MDAFIPTNDAETLVERADVPEPEPASAELVVAVEAYSINRGEVILLRGAPRENWRPGADVAGRVIHAAADGSGPAVGARVVGHAEQGGWAQQVAIATDAVAELPDGVSFEDASTLGVAALTALRLLRVAPDVAGRRLLITGASGGVGHFLTELAIARGAEVVAVSRRGERLAALGAAVVADLDAAHGPFDVVFESVGGDAFAPAAALAAFGGVVVWLGQASGAPVTVDFFATVGGDGPPAAIVPFSYWRTGASDADDLATLAGLVARGILHPEIGAVEDWTETPRLLRALADRELIGNAVLRVGG
ncbi:zinc containing alcohol dehydrogenase superfamily protein [Baekduia alba]|uniref:zinc-binding dehydrogenase n=1 Tax=Baekduia alba TaxID=2997333 RepID=UPI00234222A6|nr:zinc-binding dehydrogenase [Baekduia alba]WCB92869.1 zinc containing alcohol dehydrogenase superfamily protein [Baekduia alba]